MLIIANYREWRLLNYYRVEDDMTTRAQGTWVTKGWMLGVIELEGNPSTSSGQAKGNPSTSSGQAKGTLRQAQGRRKVTKVRKEEH